MPTFAHTIVMQKLSLLPGGDPVFALLGKEEKPADARHCIVLLTMARF